MPRKPISLHSRGRPDSSLQNRTATTRADIKAVRFRSSSQWTKLSRRVRREQPVCEDPLGIHRKANEWIPSDEVHHIVPIMQDYSLRSNRENLAGLCKFCHQKIEDMNRSGLATNHLFHTHSASK